MALPFAIFFTGQSIAIPGTSFSQADATHWVRRSVGGVAVRAGPPASLPPVLEAAASCLSTGLQSGHAMPFPCLLYFWQVLDTTTTVAPDYHQLQEVALFLTQPNPLPPDMGLGGHGRARWAGWRWPDVPRKAV